jgi:hypothetical protein
MVQRLQQPCLVESVGGGDEDVVLIAFNQIKSSSFSIVESVHLKFGNVIMSDVVNVS